MKNQYRVTKYDPSLRDATDAYVGCDWTSRSDVGRVFNGEILSDAVYLNVENSYLSVLKSFLNEAGIESLELRGMERHHAHADIFQEGDDLSIEQSLDFARLVLREEVWGKLVVPGKVYVHFGYDYYMYIGVPSKCDQSTAVASDLALFVERMRSPYLRQQPFRNAAR